MLNFNDILNYIYPKNCIFCKNILYGNGDVCASCWKKTFWISQNQVCEICGMPIKYKLEKICHQCIQNPPIFDRAISVFIYDNYSKSPILLLKNGDATYLANTFARWIYRNIKQYANSFELIIPVPMYKKKLWKRLYNQAGLIALELSKISSIRYDPFILEKVINTRPQEGLSRKMRLYNLKDAFAVKDNRKKDIQGKSIILVDDVLTTGATVNECSKLLKLNGVKYVLVVSIARVKAERKS